MKIENLNTNITTIHIFLLAFKKKICSNIYISDEISNILQWKLIFNNRNTFNPNKCYAKTDAGHQCKRAKGYCGSIFCGLHYSGKGAHIRKRNNTISRFYNNDNHTVLEYKLEFTSCVEGVDYSRLQSIYIKNEKYYINPSNGDIYNIDDPCVCIGNINSNNFNFQILV